MEVGELIEILQKYPPELNVYLSKKGYKYSWPLRTVMDDDINIDACLTLTDEEYTEQELEWREIRNGKKL